VFALAEKNIFALSLTIFYNFKMQTEYCQPSYISAKLNNLQSSVAAQFQRKLFCKFAFSSDDNYTLLHATNLLLILAKFESFRIVLEAFTRQVLQYVYAKRFQSSIQTVVAAHWLLNCAGI